MGEPVRRGQTVIGITLSEADAKVLIDQGAEELANAIDAARYRWRRPPAVVFNQLTALPRDLRISDLMMVRMQKTTLRIGGWFLIVPHYDQ